MRSLILVIGSSVLVAVLFGLGMGSYLSSQKVWDPSMEFITSEENEKDKEASDSKKSVSDMASLSGQSPKLKLTETIYDFGILEKNLANEKGEHDFVVENVGNLPLTLKEAGKGCMCTNFAISKDSIVKGETAIVKVKWDASRGGGVFDQSVRVATNDPTQKEFYLTVRGLYTSPIVSEPNQITFHAIPFNSEISRDFSIFGFEKKAGAEEPFPLEILESSIGDSEHFDIQIQNVGRDQMTDEEKEHKLFCKAQNKFVGTITAKAGIPQGSFQEVLKVKTNSPTLPVLEIMVEGQVTGATTITGNKFDRLGTGYLKIGSVSTQKTTSEHLRMTVVDKMICDEKTVRVASVRPDWLKVELNYPDLELQKVMPAKMIDVNVVIPAGSPLGNFVGPAKDQLGEIVFEIGEEANKQSIIIPVQFAVGP